MLQAINGQGVDIILDILENRAGGLYPKKPLKIFMATRNREIAKSDCLLYAVCATGDLL